MYNTYIFVYPTGAMETSVLRLGRDGQSSHSVFKTRHVDRLNAVGNLEQHVRAGDPDPGRTLLAETAERLHELVDVCLHLRPREVDCLIPRLAGCRIRHEGMATWTERECRSLGVIMLNNKNNNEN